MDADSLGLVLSRTSELRSKVINSIHRACNLDKECETSPDAKNQDDDVDEGDQSLISIKDVLESLEAQLSSLQALQQQQWYEKEAALAEIGHSQKKLIKELKEYKGKDLEVIHEAIVFAGETEDKNDLLLPPYPSRPSQSSLSNNTYLSTRKSSQNGLETIVENSESNEKQSGSWGPFKRLKMFVGAAAKMTFTIVGVIAIMSLAGFEPRVRKRDNEFKGLELFENNEKEITAKVYVKERVEIPFGSVVDTPDVSYGCG